MAVFSTDEIKHIAKLARIKLSEEEVEKFRKELSAILDFVGQLSDLDIPEAEAGKQIMDLKNIFREDKETGLVKDKGQKLINQAPKKKDGFVEVPKILEK